jgi:hypothetical protein
MTDKAPNSPHEQNRPSDPRNDQRNTKGNRHQWERGCHRQDDPREGQGKQRPGHDPTPDDPVGRLIDDLATRRAVHDLPFRRFVY